MQRHYLVAMRLVGGELVGDESLLGGEMTEKTIGLKR